MFYGLFFISKSLVMIILPFGTRSGQVRSRSGHLRSNFKVVIFAQKGCLSYAECHGESNGVLSFAFLGFTNKVLVGSDRLRHRGATPAPRAAREPLAGASQAAREPLAGASLAAREPLAGASLAAREPLADPSQASREPLAGPSLAAREPLAGASLAAREPLADAPQLYLRTAPPMRPLRHLGAGVGMKTDV
jgi:hypothetical protein